MHRLFPKFLTLLVIQCFFLSQNAFSRSISHSGAGTTVQISGWYVGAETGAATGFASLSSFGYDKFRPGFAVGVFGGYRFSRILSAELDFSTGKMNLAARECCVASGYWFGSDRQSYLAPVLGMTGWDYADIHREVSYLRHSAKLNIDLLTMFRSSESCSWSLMLSPQLGIYRTQVGFQSLSSDNVSVYESPSYHWACGGGLRIGYSFSPHISAGIYSSALFLTGKGVDGMPAHDHKANWTWESGLRLVYSFAK